MDVLQALHVRMSLSSCSSFDPTPLAEDHIFCVSRFLEIMRKMVAGHGKEEKKEVREGDISGDISKCPCVDISYDQLLSPGLFIHPTVPLQMLFLHAY